jgi:hypothetical protein
MNTTFSVVRTARTATEANLIIAVLRSHGLHPLDLRSSSHFTLDGSDTTYKVEVPAAEAKAAKEFLEALDKPRMILPGQSPNPPGQRPRKPNP